LRYLIIGTGIAGLTAAETIRKLDPEGKILLFSAENSPPYARYLLPELLALERDAESLRLRRDDFYHRNQLELHLGEAVEDVDCRSSTLSTGRRRYNFDRLLLATGARTVLPRSPLLNARGVFILRNLTDALLIDEFIRKKKVKTAAVIGAGLVGLKIASALDRRGIDVSIVEKESRILSRVLDAESQTPVARVCRENGLKLVLAERFREFIISARSRRITHLVTYSGYSLACEMAIFCPGMASNKEIAKVAGLRTGKGIKVDRFLRTSAENIYGAGDAIETFNAATGKTEFMPLWMNALQQGGIAGANMAGRRVAYEGAVWHNTLQLFGLNLVSLGQNHSADRVRGVRVVSSVKNRRGIRLFYSGDKLIGATVFGHPEMTDLLKKIILHRIPSWRLRDHLLKARLSPSLLFDSFESSRQSESCINPAALEE